MAGARGLLVSEWEEEEDAAERLASALVAYSFADSDCTGVDANMLMLRPVLMMTPCLQCHS